jgi:hypothetical protein
MVAKFGSFDSKLPSKLPHNNPIQLFCFFIHGKCPSIPTGAVVLCCSYKEVFSDGEFSWLADHLLNTTKKLPKQDGFFLCSKRRKKQKNLKKGKETHYPKNLAGGDTKPGVIEKAQTHVTLFLIYILKCNLACAVQASHITTHERKAGNDDGENKFAYKKIMSHGKSW